ncbi:OLC1v1025600C1 [Oldenlandia corymbosa var. corymbosa]|uniref:OLC1v1025600C1 n=1 Tax=Oldenlandia corymbosa var. corymbosa TaxID=529605 RepID=A0AAV1C7A5_OLDCO|nr:OLC1v1025600C1 [Oldenlandia corymbosa var. corymbosa]
MVPKPMEEPLVACKKSKSAEEEEPTAKKLDDEEVKATTTSVSAELKPGASSLKKKKKSSRELMKWKPKLKTVKTAATTLAFVFETGVMLATDHKPSVQYCQHEVAKGRTRSVGGASKWVADMVSSCDDKDSLMGLTIAGRDDENGASLYFMNNEDNLEKRKSCAIGSGSQIGYGLVVLFKAFDELSFDQAVVLLKSAISGAALDARSRIRSGKGGKFGGHISGYFVSARGSEVVFLNQDVREAQEEVNYDTRLGSKIDPP